MIASFGGVALDRPRVMAIVNVTPDSFSDGGERVDPARAIVDGLQFISEGADFVDIGGESTRPGSRAVSEEEELRRVLPVVEGLARRGALISIDTRRASVARACLEEERARRPFRTPSVATKLLGGAERGEADLLRRGVSAPRGCSGGDSEPGVQQHHGANGETRHQPVVVVASIDSPHPIKHCQLRSIGGKDRVTLMDTSGLPDFMLQSEGKL